MNEMSIPTDNHGTEIIYSDALTHDQMIKELHLSLSSLEDPPPPPPSPSAFI